MCLLPFTMCPAWLQQNEKGRFMDRFEKQRLDYAYYQDLWENPQPSPILSSPERWDKRADEWVKKLEVNEVYRTREMKRVQATADFLRKNGLLGTESTALDIGCGPGLFTAEFAKTAGHVTALDLSPRMAEHAAVYARKQGVDNTSFVAANFREADLDVLGWRKKFDLVMSSITPAITSVNDLHKMMEISRGNCLHVSFVQVADSLKDKIAAELFGNEQGTAGHWDGRVFYSVFNLLFLEGYSPQTFYFRQESCEELAADKLLAERYASLLKKDGPEREETIERIEHSCNR